MTILKQQNKIDALYEKLESGVYVENADGSYGCPVCGLSRKSLQGIKTHMEKQDCIDMKAIYTGTTSEFNGFDMFQKLKGVYTPKAHVSFTTFTKSNSYNSMMKLITIFNYFSLNHVRDDYISFILDKYQPQTVNSFLKIATQQANVEDFKIALHAYDAIKCQSYVEREMHNLKADPLFLLRSIERCKIGLMEVARNEELGALVDKLEEYPEYQQRFFELTERVSAFLKMKG